jgi:hypothetical protein
MIRMIKSRTMRCSGYVARKGEKRNEYRALVGKPKGKRPQWKLRSKWEDNIKMDLGEIEWSGMNSMNVAQDRDQCKALVNTVMKLWVP